MATQAEIQALINEIQTNASYPATKMNPLLSSMLDFASAGQTQVFDGLVANDTTMEDTTLVLEYGVNIVITATPTDYACRLPIPVTGKRVIVVNRSTFSVSLFPSMAGGQINNYAIDAPAIIPPDGNAYDFICIENPLPGAWIWSPPATNQWDSGEITGTTTVSTSYLYASNSTFVAERSGVYSAGISDGLNRPAFPNPGTPVALPNSLWGPQFKPTGTPWSSVTKVKVYTNISSNGLLDTPQALLWGAQQYNTYLAGTQTYVSAGVGVNPQFYFRENPLGNFGFNLNNVIAGVVPAPGVTTNIGDDGTCWGEIDISPSNLSSLLYSTSVGDLFISTDGINDIWLTTFLGMGIRPRVVSAGVKFRFFIEFN
jgi:hypothetical protein